jgi:hypothetical protein
MQMSGIQASLLLGPSFVVAASFATSFREETLPCAGTCSHNGRERCTGGVRVFGHQSLAPKVDGWLCIKLLRFNSDLIFLKPPRNRH